MRHLVYIILTLAIVLSPALLSAKTDWEELSLKGRVKEMHTDWESISFNEAGSFDYIEYYDLYMDYFEDGYAGCQEYQYDSLGRLLKIDEYDYEDSFLGETSYEYNEEGRLAKKVVFYSDKRTEVVYTYDSRGNLIKSRETGEGGTLLAMDTHEYDAEGKRTRTSVYESNEETPEKISDFSYDDKGNLLLETVSDASGTILERKAYKYDSHNRKTEYVIQDLLSTITTTYSYIYDHQGNVTEETKTIQPTNETMISTSTYTYDEHGNWTRCETKEGDRVAYVATRTISYY